MADTMIAVTASRYTPPAGYELTTVPRPEVTTPADVVIRVHAASINPVDVKKIDGIFKQAFGEKFPYVIGFDASGVVTAVGEDVKGFKVGDEVYTRLPEVSRGSWSEYVKCSETVIASKPKGLSFADAASLPLASQTALQALRQYRGSLEGKTVFVPAGLSGTGLFACQLAKNIFHAGKVITTVSTNKVEKVSELLGEGVVDQIIDYTKDNPLDLIPKQSVDFLFDTTGQSMAFLPLITSGTGTVVSISMTPSAATLQGADVMQRPDSPRIPLVARLFLDTLDSIRKFRARRHGVEYMYWFVRPNGDDLRTIAGYVEEGKLRTVVGSRVDLRDIDKVKEACQRTYDSKGGLGKTVFDVIKD